MDERALLIDSEEKLQECNPSQICFGTCKQNGHQKEAPIVMPELVKPVRASHVRPETSGSN